MENITDLSFNDEVVPAAKPSEAAQPMVVVQYRTRGVPWWLLSLLTVFAPLCTVLIYHSLFVGRYRAQAVETAEALRTRLDGAPPAEVKKTPEAALPLALNSQPIAAPREPAPPASSVVPSSGAASASRDQAGNMASAVSPAGPLKPDLGPASGEAAQAQKAQEAPSSGGSRSVSSSSALVPGATPHGPAAGSGRLPSSGGAPTVAAKAADGPAAAGPKSGVDSTPPNSSATATAALQFVERNKDRLSAFDRSPFDDPSEERAPLKPVRPGEIDPARPSSQPAHAKAEDKRPVGEPGGAGIPPVLPPLPTREETERQFKAEAAQNFAEQQDQLEKKAAELRSSRYQERVKFREELRAALQQDASLAGPEINQLAKRYSYDTDPDRLMQANHIWRVSRVSQAAKVKMIRALDLPETVILDFLSDEFHQMVRNRNGPRNENEVRIRAAYRLLQLELPPEDAMPAARQPADSMPGRTLRSRALPYSSGPVQRGR